MLKPYCSKILTVFLFLVILVNSQQELQKNLFIAEQSKRLMRYDDMISYINLFLKEAETSQYNPRLEELINFNFEQLNSMLNSRNPSDKIKSLQEEKESELKQHKIAALMEYQSKIMTEFEKRYLDFYTSISQSFKSEELDIKTHLFKQTYMPLVFMKMHKIKSFISGKEIYSQFEKSYEIAVNLMNTTSNLCFDVFPLRTAMFYSEFLNEYTKEKQLAQKVIKDILDFYETALIQDEQELVCLQTDVYHMIKVLFFQARQQLYKLYDEEEQN